ncbi:hypothetical protein [Mycobacterium camsae]|uniref:hypothetical protein n=1 Tax=Mycobacterium gordonae TaxID=1778 RepID=UPI00198015EC
MATLHPDGHYTDGERARDAAAPAPAYHCQVHHISYWATTHCTDIHDLTLARGPHNRLAGKARTTRKTPAATPNGGHRTPMDYGQPRTNTVHRPEKLLGPDDEDEP